MLRFGGRGADSGIVLTVVVVDDAGARGSCIDCIILT